MIISTKEIQHIIKDSEALNQELSFDKLISFLEKQILEADTFEQNFPKLVLERIHALQESEGPITPHNIEKFEEIFSYVYYLTSNVLAQEEVFWAIGCPIPDHTLYGQPDFLSKLDAQMELIDVPLSTPIYNDFNFSNKVLYLLILERFYKLPTLQFKPLYSLIEEEVKKYFQLRIDFSFMEISLIADELPVLDLSCVHEKEINSYEDIAPFLESIDLKNFLFKGFTVLKLVDKTNEQAGVKIQHIISKLPGLDVLLDLTSFNKELIWNEIKDVIKTLANSAKVQSSFFPLLEINGVPVLTSALSKESVFFGELIQRQPSSCTHEVYSYLKAPYTISYGLEEKYNTSDTEFIAHLQSLGYTSYICFPLKNKRKLVGFLELFTKDELVLDKKGVLNVVSFLPLITNLAMDLVSTFKNAMDKVILDKYTSLQEAVQWKFNQSAANYLSNISSNHFDIPLDKITFDKVYPVYGAVDVRNSTKLRNIAYKKDSYQRLGMLQLIIDQLESSGLNEEHKKFIFRFNLVKSWLDEGKFDQYLLDILSFFQEEVFPFLSTLDHTDLILVKYKEEYKRDNHGLQYVLNGDSQQFEHTLMLLNEIIGSELDSFNSFVQQQFPSYFEKFRTDGIEYDLYIGQSITPTQVFDPMILQNIRRQQIVSMVSIARKTFKALDQLPIPLVTTQLIFIHPNPIDISFRQDERRFDVEGGYNIRYEVIKKRIDKATLKGTNERLVQPNKIAIVYSSPRLEDELRTLIQSIVAENLIAAEIEELVLEELQGIEQLKAFRVTVTL